MNVHDPGFFSVQAPGTVETGEVAAGDLGVPFLCRVSAGEKHFSLYPVENEVIIGRRKGMEHSVECAVAEKAERSGGSPLIRYVS